MLHFEKITQSYKLHTLAQTTWTHGEDNKDNEQSILASLFSSPFIRHMVVLEENEDSEQSIIASLCSSPFIRHMVVLEDNKDNEKHLLATLARPSFLPISFC